MTGRPVSERWRPNLGKWLAPPRFLLFAAVAAITATVFSRLTDFHHALLGGYDAGAIVFLVSLLPLFRERSAEAMRRRAAANDANRALLLLLSMAIMVAVLGALAIEIAAKDHPTPLAIGLILLTLVSSWLFTNTIFALHYAHVYYSRSERGGDGGGIDFPGDASPYFSDFLYFAFCLGMTFQTSDTNITSTRVRKIATLHAMAAFVFSIGVIAFTINVLGGGGTASTLAATR